MKDQSSVQLMIARKIRASGTAALEKENRSSNLQRVKGTTDDAFPNAKPQKNPEF
jgi:hypothetical protein